MNWIERKDFFLNGALNALYLTASITDSFHSDIRNDATYTGQRFFDAMKEHRRRHHGYRAFSNAVRVVVDASFEQGEK